MKKLSILFLILGMLLLLSANTFAEVPDLRFTYLGGANGFNYFAWESDHRQNFNKPVWIKIKPDDTGLELLKQQGGLPDNSLDIDSILCRIDIKADIKNIQVTEQIYYDGAGNVIEQNNNIQAVAPFIANQCVSFLTSYFIYK